MFQELIVYIWPTSQICMDCIHGTFVTVGSSDEEYPSAYLCDKKCKDNDGVNCPNMEPKEEEEDE